MVSLSNHPTAHSLSISPLQVFSPANPGKRGQALSPFQNEHTSDGGRISWTHGSFRTYVAGENTCNGDHFCMFVAGENTSNGEIKF